MASTEVLEQPPKKHKTCVLRVSIHCEGCKRKVKKLLQSLPGVEDIEIERQQQRVVVTGNVLPETLLNKLLKAGKHAQFWPENPPNARKIEKPPSTSQVSVSEDSVVPGKETMSAGPVANTQETLVEDKSKSTKTSVAGTGDPASGSGGKIDERGKKAVEVEVELKGEEKKLETGPAGGPTSTPVVENKDDQKVSNGGGTGGGEEKIKRKKKKKPQNSDGNGNNSGGPHESVPRSTQNPPRQHGYDNPPRHHYLPPPPAPVYTMSYNTAHPPANSYTASYYAPQPPQSYAYSHVDMPTPHVAFGHESYAQQQQPRYESYPQQPPRYESFAQQPRYESYAQQQPPVDSFEMFSDENPNGCLVM